MMDDALAQQQARRLDEAEQKYRAVLAVVPDEPDALHMLGVVRYDRGDLAEARELIVRALDLTGWRIVAMRKNLGLVLSRQKAVREVAQLASLRRRYDDFLDLRRARTQASNPLVSVVVPSYNHSSYIANALRSIFDQTYRHIEIVVIDDGSRDDSPRLIESCLRQSPFPQRFVARENRGAPATLNEGIAMARGRYVQFLNSDDWLASDRIARLIAEVAGADCGWGFAGVSFGEESGAPVDVMRNRRAFDITCSQAKIPYRATVGRAFLNENVAVSTGNLFVASAFLERLGGFRDYRYIHDWDFCLRALQVEEPVFIAEPLYFYRLHGANTIDEAGGHSRSEAHEICTEYLAWARNEPNPENPFAPALATWGVPFINAILKSGMGGMLDAQALRQLALA